MRSQEVSEWKLRIGSPEELQLLPEMGVLGDLPRKFSDFNVEKSVHLSAFRANCRELVSVPVISRL